MPSVPAMTTFIATDIYKTNICITYTYIYLTHMCVVVVVVCKREKERETASYHDPKQL